MSQSVLRVAVISAGIVSLLGCQSGSDPSQLAKEKSRAEAAEANAQSARTELAAEKAPGRRLPFRPLPIAANSTGC